MTGRSVSRGGHPVKRCDKVSCVYDWRLLHEIHHAPSCHKIEQKSGFFKPEGFFGNSFSLASLRRKFYPSTQNIPPMGLRGSDSPASKDTSHEPEGQNKMI